MHAVETSKSPPPHNIVRKLDKQTALIGGSIPWKSLGKQISTRCYMMEFVFRKKQTKKNGPHVGSKNRTEINILNGKKETK